MYLDCPANDALAPYPQGCLRKWWLDAGCSENGLNAPIVESQYGWSPTLTVAQIQQDYSMYRQLAKTNTSYELLCGNAHNEPDQNSNSNLFVAGTSGHTDIPCSSIDSTARAPFQMGCVLEWWLEAGCTSAGTASPALTTTWWGIESLTVANIKHDMGEYYRLATANSGEYRKYCAPKSGIE